MIALLLCAAAVLPPGLLPGAAPLTLDQYRERLAQVDASLQRGDRNEAAREAQALLSESISTDDGALSPDRAALEPIADPGQPPHRARLLLLLKSLGVPAPGSREAAPDKAALDSLRAREASRVLVRGGAVSALDVNAKPVLASMLDSLKRGSLWLLRRIWRLLRWIYRSFPGTDGKSGGWSRTNLVIFIATGFVLALVVLLAVRARLLRKTELAPLAQVARAAVADEDPLSRSTSEWETRARDLTAAGHAREAIRAWYHAVLVACYATGLLHHRRGRTNWEYAAALSPDAAWRPRFFALTRWFDEQWYGRSQSSAEALALFAEDATHILRALRERAR